MTHDGIAERIAALRTSKTLTQAQVAQAMGINDMWVYDIESYDDDLPQTLSLRQVCDLARILDVAPRHLVCGPESSGSPTAASPEDVAQAIKTHLAAQQMTIDEFEHAVGWDCASAASDPTKLWTDWNLNQAQEVCDAIGIDWRTILPLSNDREAV